MLDGVEQKRCPGREKRLDPVLENRQIDIGRGQDKEMGLGTTARQVA